MLTSSDQSALMCWRVTDIDECVTMPGLCANGRCRNTLGSFQCICQPGFHYNNERMICEGIERILSLSFIPHCTISNFVVSVTYRSAYWLRNLMSRLNIIATFWFSIYWLACVCLTHFINYLMWPRGQETHREGLLVQGSADQSMKKPILVSSFY